MYCITDIKKISGKGEGEKEKWKKRRGKRKVEKEEGEKRRGKREGEKGELGIPYGNQKMCTVTNIFY